MLIDQLGYDKTNMGDGKLRTLKIKTSRLDKEMANILHENLVRLADANTIKVEDPTANRKISRFFRRLIIGEYLRTGITKTADSLAPILPTDSLMTLLEEPMAKVEKSGIDTKTLEDYNTLFMSNWSKSRMATRNKFRNYIQTQEDVNGSVDEATKTSISITPLKENTFKFNHALVRSGVQETLKANPEKVFVYSNGISAELVDAFFKGGNSIGIPVKDKGNKSWTDATYDSNITAINNSISLIKNQIDAGQSVGFPEYGFTNSKSGNALANAPRTFTYLATELYKNFGFIHPGAEENLGFRKEFQAGQDISDDEVTDTINKLIEESKNCNS
jgi:hypothetical protein